MRFLDSNSSTLLLLLLLLLLGLFMTPLFGTNSSRIPTPTLNDHQLRITILLFK